MNDWNDSRRGYPYVIAHRGYSARFPENTLPAFAAAVALRADEIELDVWPSADGELVVIHDMRLDRTTDLTGNVQEMRWADIARADAGVKCDPEFTGTRVPRLEEVLEMLAGKTLFNIHIKTAGEDGAVIRQIDDLVEKYCLYEDLYVAGNNAVMEAMMEYAPLIERCCLSGSNGWNLVDKGIEYQCGRVQFRNEFCNEEQIQKAHETEITCNLFYADTAAEAEKYYEMGIDCILTNNLAEVMPVAIKRRQRDRV